MNIDDDWRLIPGHPDYRINKNGDFESKKRGDWKRMHPTPDGGGYLQAFMCEKGKMHVRKVHKLMQDVFFEPDPEKPEINHINGNKRDNRLENLEQCSRLENQHHACEHGLWTHPDNAGRPKRKVRIVETGDVYDSLSSCAEAVNGDVTNLCNCLRGTRKTHRGYHFEYV